MFNQQILQTFYFIFVTVTSVTPFFSFSVVNRNASYFPENIPEMDGWFHSKIMKSAEKNRGSDKKGKAAKAKRADLRGGTVKHPMCFHYKLLSKVCLFFCQEQM